MVFYYFTEKVKEKSSGFDENYQKRQMAEATTLIISEIKALQQRQNMDSAILIEDSEQSYDSELMEDSRLESDDDGSEYCEDTN